MSDNSTNNDFGRSTAELAMLYEISTAMRATLKLDEILYIILTSVTAKEGLGFNRATLFLVNSQQQLIQGQMGIGPDSGKHAQEIWSRISEERMTMDNLINAYQEFDKRTHSQLNNLVKSMSLPLNYNSGILAKTILDGIPFNINSAEKKAQISPDDAAVKKLQLDFFATMPLKAKDRVVGVILVDNPFTLRSITDNDIKILSMFADQAGLAIENSQTYEEMVILSNTDRLTGLWNHGYFQYQLSEELKRASRFNRLASLIMVDLDYFKLYNDTYGHVAGDKILQSLAEIFRSTCREIDFIARYGGEEFVVTLPETNKENAFLMAERIRKNILEKGWKNGDQNLTISCGVACFPHDANDRETLIDFADRALYMAKNSGRNRTCMFSPEMRSLRRD